MQQIFMAPLALSEAFFEVSAARLKHEDLADGGVGEGAQGL